MKTLPKMGISDELDMGISEGMKISELCKADVVRQALRIGLPQFAARFQPAPLWLEERVREALAEPAETVTTERFRKRMKAIADGRQA
jgi:ABC-type thiamine transport system ATPase subunit